MQSRRTNSALGRTLLACTFMLELGACGEDLGPCDERAAQELVYDAQGSVATKGQAMLHGSCGQAAFCHSTNAKHGARFGAPSNLDFDMLPAPTGWPTTLEERDTIWSAIRDGSMPPGKIGHEKQSQSVWSVDIDLDPRAPTLPQLSSDRGKAIVRNWLACGAPVVSATKLPSWARRPQDDADGGSAPDDFSDIYADILKPSCAVSGCHDAAAAGGLRMTDECGALTQLMAAGSCGARIGESADTSLLVSKLEDEKPKCGGPMPPLGALPAAQIERVRAWVQAGAMSRSCR